MRRGEEYGEGCPPPHPTRGSGERRELHKRGPGRNLVHSDVCRMPLVQRFTKFCSIISYNAETVIFIFIYIQMCMFLYAPQIT